MDGKQQGDGGLRDRLAKVEDGLRRLGGIYSGLRALAALAAVAAAVVFFALSGWGGGGSPEPSPSPTTTLPESTPTPDEVSLDEYCERSARYAAAWVEFQSSASRGELRPGDLGPAIDNIWSTHAVAPPELEDDYELLATSVEELDEDLSGDALADIATLTALFVTNGSVLGAVDTIDAFDAEHCSDT